MPIIAEDPDFIRQVLEWKWNTRGRKNDLQMYPLERQKEGLDVAYSEELMQIIKKEMSSYPKSKQRSKDFKRLKTEFEQIDTEDIYASENLEEILYELTGYRTSRDRNKAIDKIIEEKGWYSINRLKTHEEMEELMLDVVKLNNPYQKESLEIKGLEFFYHTKGNFPEEIMFFTTDELGIMAFNKLKDDSHFVGVSGSPILDDEVLSTFTYFEHDLLHMQVTRIGSNGSVPQQILKRIENIPKKSDRQMAEVALFIYRHEIGGEIGSREIYLNY